MDANMRGAGAQRTTLRLMCSSFLGCMASQVLEAPDGVGAWTAVGVCGDCRIQRG